MPDSKIIYRSIDKLLFDPLNPRVPVSRRTSGQKSIVQYMIDNENLIDVIASIGEQDFFPGEPLLIVKSSNVADCFEVVEGNRRLASLLVLNDLDLVVSKKNAIRQLVVEAKFRPNSVPTLLFDTRDEILDYLGYKHITGIDDWDSLQKARFLTQLADRHSSSDLAGNDLYKHLAKLIGSRSDYVMKLLSGFKIYNVVESNDFYDIPGLDEETFSFSLLTTAASYSNIREFIGIQESNSSFSFDENNLSLLVDWMFRKNSEGSTRIPESRALKTLNAVVKTDIALRKFKEGRTLEEAGLLTSEPRENFNLLLTQAYQRLLLAQDSVHHISDFREEDKSLSNDIKNLSKTIHTMVLHSNED